MSYILRTQKTNPDTTNEQKMLVTEYIFTKNKLGQRVEGLEILVIKLISRN